MTKIIKISIVLLFVASLSFLSQMDFNQAKELEQYEKEQMVGRMQARGEVIDLDKDNTHDIHCMCDYCMEENYFEANPINDKDNE